MTLEFQADRWVVMSDAPERIGRNRSTIYKWVKAGKIRTMRPGRALWLYLPDLLSAEKESIRRVSLANGEETA
jgi:excisionase family DNA binding protein